MTQQNDAATSRKLRRAGIVRIVLVGLLAVALAITGLVWHSTRPIPPGQAKTAEQSVLGYLQAVAQGSASDALSFLDTVPTDTTFLTDDVLAYSRTFRPITHIKVSSAYGYNTKKTVNASYLIGDYRPFDSFNVILKEGYWVITNAPFGPTSEYYYYPFLTTVNSADISLNGVPLNGLNLSDISLFPGAYQYETSNRLLTMDGTTLLISGNRADTREIPPRWLSLTAEGQTEIADAVTSKLNDCLTEKASFTSCGFGFNWSNNDSQERNVDNSTVVWSTPSGIDDSNNLVVLDWMAIEDGGPLRAVAWIGGKVACEGTSAKGSLFMDSFRITTETIDVTDPDKLVITFFTSNY